MHRVGLSTLTDRVKPVPPTGEACRKWKSSFEKFKLITRMKIWPNYKKIVPKSINIDNKTFFRWFQKKSVGKPQWIYMKNVGWNWNSSIFNPTFAMYS